MVRETAKNDFFSGPATKLEGGGGKALARPGHEKLFFVASLSKEFKDIEIIWFKKFKLGFPALKYMYTGKN